MNEWIYIQYNYTTERYEVLKQIRGVANDVVLKSFKREGNAHNYELNLTHNLQINMDLLYIAIPGVIIIALILTLLTRSLTDDK